MSDIDSGAPKIVQWYVDTRPLWPVSKKPHPREEVAELKIVASRALSLLPEPEQAQVLKYYHPRDAKTKLASHLLKRLVIHRFTSTPWSSITISKGPKGKPYFASPSRGKRVDFNVSHQAGVVGIIATINCKEPVDVGADVVCASERHKQDYSHIDQNGFFDWVDMHDEVFSSAEVSFMKLAPVPVDVRVKGASISGYGLDQISRVQWRNGKTEVRIQGADGEDMSLKVDNNKIIDDKLRRFYACWCLREAYVKMTGEALLAPWLKELEILNVVPPLPKLGVDVGDGDLVEGECVRQYQNLFKGKIVEDVKMELTAFGRDYMICGCVRLSKELLEMKEGKGIEFGKWVGLDLERDILTVAEAAG